MKKLFKSPTRSWLVVAAVVVVGFSIAQPAYAGAWDTIWENIKNGVLTLISWVLYFFLIYLMGKLAVMATDILIYVAQLNNFTDLPVIIEAWSVVRDLANLFFIVVLLVIAFGTLFRIEAYSWKKLLPKMVLAAILVNYSRAIVGFMVDASQVVMLTFVAAIKDVATIGFTEAFNLDELLSFQRQSGDEATGGSKPAEARFMSIVVAGFMLATMFTVQCVYIVVLVGRLVMIWFLTVMSPLAFATSVLPATEKFSRQWWEMLGRYITVGPMAMFFLWLAMFVAAKSVDSGGLGSVAATTAQQNNLAAETDSLLTSVAAGVLQTDVIAGFVIATLMLMAGMKLALENSSEISEYTGKAANFGKVVGGFVGVTATVGLANYANERQFARTGFDLNAPRVVHRWKEGWEKNKKDRVLQGESVAAQKYREGYFLAGALGAGDQVAELGIKREQLRGGIGGNIPLFRGWGKFRRNVFGGRQGKFEKALIEEKALQKKSADNNEKIKRAESHGEFKTVAEYEDELAKKNAMAKGEFDCGNDAQRAIVEEYHRQLEKLASDKTLTEEQRNKVNTLAEKVKTNIDNKSDKIKVDGKSFQELGPKIMDNVNAMMNTAKKELPAYEARKDEITNKGEFKTKDDISTFKNPEYKKLLAKQIEIMGKDGKGGLLQGAKERREKYGSLVGSGGEIKFRKLINEAAGNITSEDTTELCDGFKDALHKGSGFGPEALAYFDRLANTNNVNDLLKDPAVLKELKEIDPEIDNPYSMEGMQALEKLMIKEFKLPEQAVRASLHRGFQHMKRIGNTFMSEMTEVKNGQFEWRSPADWQNVALIEGRKRNGKQQLASATRLQVGDGDGYYEQQRFVLENLGSLIAPNLNTDKSVTINADIIRHLKTDWRRYAVMRNKVVNSVKDTTLRKQAVAALNEVMRKNGVELAAAADDYNKIIDIKNDSNKLYDSIYEV